MTFVVDVPDSGNSSFSVAPSSATVAADASAAGRPVVTIELRDALGNTVSGQSGAITLVFTSTVGVTTSLAVVEVGSSGTYTTAINSQSAGTVDFEVQVNGSTSIRRRV